MHVVDCPGGGEGPPVVLLHGFSSAAVHYLPLILRLRPHVTRVVAPDFPAHGLSEAPAAGINANTLQAGLFEALDAVLDAPAVLYGNSMGGAAAVRYAASRPERMAALMLCSPGGAPMTSGEISALVSCFRLTCHSEALGFIDRVFGRRIVGRHLLALGVRGRFGSRHFRALLESFSEQDSLAPAEVRALRPPVHLVWGRADGLLPSSQLEFFRRNLPPQARVDEPPSFGHSPYLDQPGAVARQILALADSVTRRAPRANRR